MIERREASPDGDRLQIATHRWGHSALPRPGRSRRGRVCGLFLPSALIAITVGTPVGIIYKPVLLALLDDGRIFVEANPDAYRKAPNTLAELRGAANSNMIGRAIDWYRVEQALQRRDGLAHDVSLANADKGGGATWQMAAVKSSCENRRGEAGGQQPPRNPVRHDQHRQIPIPTP